MSYLFNLLVLIGVFDRWSGGSEGPNMGLIVFNCCEFQKNHRQASVCCGSQDSPSCKVFDERDDREPEAGVVQCDGSFDSAVLCRL